MQSSSWVSNGRNASLVTLNVGELSFYTRIHRYTNTNHKQTETQTERQTQWRLQVEIPHWWQGISESWVSRHGYIQTTNAGYLTDQQVWFPVDFQETFSRKFSRICSFIDTYRAGSLTPGTTLILFTQAIAQLKDIYQGLIALISINPGLMQDVFTGTLWSTRILSQPENFQETLLISSRFPGFPGGKIIPVDFQDFRDFQEC